LYFLLITVDLAIYNLHYLIMKTRYIIIVSLFISSYTYSQNHVASSKHFYRSRAKLTTSLSSFTTEIVTDKHFNYSTFLYESKKSKAIYRVANEQISKEQLVKIFRKGSRKSSNKDQFFNYLLTKYNSIYNQLSIEDLNMLYTNFKDKRVEMYLDELPSIL